MAKTWKTKYATVTWEDITEKTIIGKLDKIKTIKRSRRYRCHYASITVKPGKREVKLFFCCSMGNKTGLYLYNLLASIKRTLDYAIIGALFHDVYERVYKLTVIDKIRWIIHGVVSVIAERM